METVRSGELAHSFAEESKEWRHRGCWSSAVPPASRSECAGTSAAGRGRPGCSHAAVQRASWRSVWARNPMVADGDRIGRVAARVRSRERGRGHRSEAAVGIGNQHLVMAGQSSAGARRQVGDLALLGLAVLMRGADLTVEASA
jgi:hypothetical protein